MLMSLMVTIATGLAQKKDDINLKVMNLPEDVNEIVNYSQLPIVYASGRPRIEISCGDATISDLDYEISGNTLTINGLLVNSHESHNKTTKDRAIKVYGYQLGSLKLYGSGDFEAQNVDGTGITLRSYGSGNIRIRNLDSTRLQIDLYGTGKVGMDNIDCTSLVMLSCGTGNMEFKDIDSTTTEIMLQGTGNIKIHNLDATSLKISNNGTGKVTVDGDVTTAVMINNGTGSIDISGLSYTRLTKIMN